MRRWTHCALLLAVSFCAVPGSAQASDPVAYVQGLRGKYGNRIQFATPQARKTVEDFSLDCQAPDGRVLPLMNVMLAKLAQLDSKDSYLTARVDSRGNDVRVYDEFVQGGKVVDSRVAFEINKWGELRSLVARVEALRNACFGSFGPIWLLPTAARVASAPAGNAKKLIEQQTALNSKCRGGSGDSPATQAACADRDKLSKQIEAAGWCWGPEDAVGADKRWIRCR